jgi:hypothetical protein
MATKKCRAAFTESNTFLSTPSGNNVGACCLCFNFAFLLNCKVTNTSHAINLTFASKGLVQVKLASPK